VDERTVRRAEQHVETAEQFPFMQAGTWRQEITPEAQEQTMAILGCAKVLDPELAVNLVENIGAKAPAEREKLYP
jgi:hypothetical protein